jgi:hypothetical protein
MVTQSDFDPEYGISMSTYKSVLCLNLEEHHEQFTAMMTVKLVIHVTPSLIMLVF